MNKDKIITLRIDKELDNHLKLKMVKDNTTLSQIIRDILNEYFKL